MSIRQKIINAGQNFNIVKIKAYKKDGSYTERICEPYSFREKSTGTIFHLLCLERNDWRSLRLKDIFDVQILSEPFRPRVKVEF
jgi:predicted DNA-binding transcriptional regulator YafY